MEKQWPLTVQILFLSQYNSYWSEQMHKKAVSWYSLHLCGASLLPVVISVTWKKILPHSSGRALAEEAKGTLRLDTSELDSLALFLEYL